MTTELLNKGLDAARDINKVVLSIHERDNTNEKDCLKIQEDLSVITDVLQEAFLDMIKADNIKAQLEIINKTLSEHLNRFQ